MDEVHVNEGNSGQIIGIQLGTARDESFAAVTCWVINASVVNGLAATKAVFLVMGRWEIRRHAHPTWSLPAR